MKAVVRAGVVFLVFAATPSLLLSGLLLASRPPGRPDATGDFLLAATFVGVSCGLATIGFVIPLVLNSAWRRLTTTRSVLIAAVSGLLAPVATVVIAAIGSAALLPLLRSASLWGVALYCGLPGLLLGVVASLIASATIGGGRKAADVR